MALCSTGVNEQDIETPKRNAFPHPADLISEAENIRLSTDSRRV